MRRAFEEILEAIWMCEEQGKNRVDAVCEICHTRIEGSLLPDMQKEELIVFDGTYVYMSGKGREIAKGLIRRKRLGEVLLEYVLDIKGDRADKIVCEFEHAVVPEVEESICILLGHPTDCPHGHKIPPGNCCIQGKRDIEKKVDSIVNFNIGENIKVAYIKPGSHDQLHKLMNFGIKPGMHIEIHQKKPVFIIRYNNSEIAMDSEMAKAIYGWGAGDQPTATNSAELKRGCGKGWGFRVRRRGRRRP